MIELPGDTPATIADWIELYLAVEGDAISKAEIARIIEGSTGEESSDALLSSVWLELENRMQRYHEPSFALSDKRVTRVKDMSNAYYYIACLILSLFGVTDEHLSSAKLFERLSALAIKEYLNGEVFIFGWPVLAGGDAAIGVRMRKAAEQLREKLAETPAERYKDRGVDIIAWKPFFEQRSCQYVILAQCAAGKHWQNKTKDLPFESWTQYIHWANNPVKAFFVPCIIQDDLWHDISREAGILFDRVRIINLLPDGILDGNLDNEFKTWTERQLVEHTI